MKNGHQGSKVRGQEDLGCLPDTSLGLGLTYISAITKENIIFSIQKWLWPSIYISLNEDERIGFPV